MNEILKTKEVIAKEYDAGRMRKAFIVSDWNDSYMFFDDYVHQLRMARLDGHDLYGVQNLTRRVLFSFAEFLGSLFNSDTTKIVCGRAFDAEPAILLDFYHGVSKNYVALSRSIKCTYGGVMIGEELQEFRVALNELVTSDFSSQFQFNFVMELIQSIDCLLMFRPSNIGYSGEHIMSVACCIRIACVSLSIKPSTFDEAVEHCRLRSEKKGSLDLIRTCFYSALS